MTFRGALFLALNEPLQPKVESPETLGGDDVFNSGFRYFHRVCPTDEHNFSFGSPRYFTCVYMDEDFIGYFIGPVGEMVHASYTKGP